MKTFWIVNSIVAESERNRVAARLSRSPPMCHSDISGGTGNQKLYRVRKR